MLKKESYSERFVNPKPFNLSESSTKRGSLKTELIIPFKRVKGESLIETGLRKMIHRIARDNKVRVIISNRSSTQTLLKVFFWKEISCRGSNNPDHLVNLEKLESKSQELDSFQQREEEFLILDLFVEQQSVIVFDSNMKSMMLQKIGEDFRVKKEVMTLEVQVRSLIRLWTRACGFTQKEMPV